MPRIIIAEKPSQARDIAKVLNVQRDNTGYITLNDGCAVTWPIGHLLESVEPTVFNPDGRAR